MMDVFHFLRPLWLLLFLPFVVLVFYLLREKLVSQAWREICDTHLLDQLMSTKGPNRRKRSLGLLFASAFFAIIAMAGPTWSKLPVPTYQYVQPRVLVLDMSDAMLMSDVTPDRLRRAKFKLHDLLQHQGQWGLVVYTGEPFVVSPLTDDGQTIDALLSSLMPDVMPVEGQRLDAALVQAGKLIGDAGFSRGQILVLTGSSPTANDIAAAKSLAKAGIETSIIPVMGEEAAVNPLFQRFASAGNGKFFSLSDTSKDINEWLAATRKNQQFSAKVQGDIPVFRDQGRWFLILALLCLLPAFRRGWLQGIGV